MAVQYSVAKRMAPNEVGNVYGRLTVLKQAPTVKNHSRWVCLCDCGNTLIVLGTSIRSGNTKSCGCLHSEVARKQSSKPVGEAAFNRIVGNMMRMAARRGLDWLLTMEEVQDLVHQECHYCGIPYSNEVKVRTGNFLYNGIDRVDNAKGYVKGNVVPCCIHCNTAKSDMDLAAFKSWAFRLYNRFQGE